MDTSRPLAFGTLLRRHRLTAGLTQEELAARARVSRRSIGDLERGVGHRPRRDTVALLAAALALPRPIRRPSRRRRGTPVRMPPPPPSRWPDPSL